MYDPGSLLNGFFAVGNIQSHSVLLTVALTVFRQPKRQAVKDPYYDDPSLLCHPCLRVPSTWEVHLEYGLWISFFGLMTSHDGGRLDLTVFSELDVFKTMRDFKC